MSNTYDELATMYPAIPEFFNLEPHIWDNLSCVAQRDWVLMRLAILVDERNANVVSGDIDGLMRTLEKRVEDMLGKIKRSSRSKGPGLGFCVVGDCPGDGCLPGGPTKADVIIGGQPYCGFHAASATIEPNVR
jgi:hypothetical protein